MRRKLLLFSFLICNIICVLAQDSARYGNISGQAEDTLNQMSLNGAKVTLIRLRDSSVIRSMTIAGGDGKFSFEKVPLDSFWVRISYTGFSSMRQKVILTPENTTYALSPFYMAVKSNNLDEVVVVSIPPITIKPDTTEFNADAYHVKPNSNVEDLIKKIPGIDVDASGNIKAQGESVTRVYVNGKRFFGDDPKMATQNLPPDVVDKIQVFDALSDQSQFTGFDDGNRVKSINIVTKKNAQTGYFGKMIAGGGGELSNGSDGGIYAGGAAIHRFNGDQQLSLLLQANNNNQQMFTSQDILGTSGRGGGGRGGAGGSFGGGSTGLTRTLAGGLNYRDQWGKSTSAYGSYFYNNQRTVNGSNSLKQMIYSDTSQNNDQNTISNALNQNQNHRIQFNVETTIDTLNSFIFRPNFSTQNTDITNSQTTDIYKNENGVKNYISRTNSNTYSHNSGYNGTLDLLLRHKFKKAGRTLSADITWTGSSNDGYGTNFNIINTTSSTSSGSTLDTLNQQYTTDSKSNGISTTLTYTEPIAKYQLLQLAYNYSYTKNTSNRTTYDFDSTTMGYTQLNDMLTNHYENSYTSNRATLSYLFNNSKINFSAGTGVQFGHQTSVNLSKNYPPIDRNYTNMYPTLNFRYLFTKTSNIRFNYQGRTSQPSVSQLQPVTDNSDPLNVTSGNPDLKQSFSHSFRVLYSDFNRSKSTNMFASVNFSTTQNAITNMITRLSNGGQSTMPVNINGNYTLSSYFNYGFPINSPKSNLNFSTNISVSKTPGLMADSVSGQPFILDTIRNNSYSYSFGETFKWTTNLDSLFDINIFTTPSYTINRYTNQSQNSNHYFSQAIAVDASWYTGSGWILTNNFTYTYYRGIVNTSIPLWNISFARQVLKNKRGEIKISVYDLLNQNKGIAQATGQNYIQQTTSVILKRYAQLTFTYNIRNFAQQGQNNRMPGFFGGDRGGWGGGGRGRMNM